jgi:hypothetical protein
VGLGTYPTGKLAIVAVALIALGALLIFVIDWLGALLVIAGTIVGFVLLMRFVQELD